MSDSQYLYNGESCSTLLEHGLVQDRGLLYGDGVFETIAVRNSAIPLKAFHLQRLASSCEKLALSLDEQSLLEQIDRLLINAGVNAKAINGKLKIIVTRSGQGRASYPATNASSNILLSFHSGQEPLSGGKTKIKRAQTPLYSMPILAGIKHLNRLNYIAAAVHENIKQNEELLFCDEKGNVVETMHGNIFFVTHDGKVETPLLENLGVAGVMRRVVMEELGPQFSIKVKEKHIVGDAISNYAEIFISNAMQGIVSVSAFVSAKECHTFHYDSIASRLRASLERYLKAI